MGTVTRKSKEGEARGRVISLMRTDIYIYITN